MSDVQASEAIPTSSPAQTLRHWREPEEAAKNIVRSAYKRPGANHITSLVSFKLAFRRNAHNPLMNSECHNQAELALRG